MNLEIPNDILTASEMTEAELKLEIAIILHKRKKISAGKACEWLGLNLVEFRRELGKRGLSINYDVEDFQADLETLRSLAPNLSALQFLGKATS
jgi:predicted HTH domain antitoxin